MKVGILTMESYENRHKDSVGSSRIRGTWLLKHWPEAELFKIGQKYEAIIFQKAYHTRLMNVFQGVKVLDICDPDWLEGRKIKETVELCDAVTCSSEALADFIGKITDKPVYFIPDRMDLAYYNVRKHHVGRAQSVVWFGYSSNHKLIDQSLGTIKRLNLDLTVISEQPYFPSGNVAGIDSVWINAHLKNIKYDQDNINQDIINSGDILLNPKSDLGKFKFKSNNKTLTGWALGMPVAHDSDEMEAFLEAEARIIEAEKRLKEVQEIWDVKISAQQMRDIVNTLAKNKGII